MSFLKYAEVYEAHRIAAVAWSSLGRNIEIELALKEERRKNCRDFLKVWRSATLCLEPKRDFVLTLGFALQRANSRMLRGADKRRRKARGSGLYSSGTRPFSSSSDDDY